VAGSNEVYAPLLRSDVLVRPRLTQALQQALSDDKILLVSQLWEEAASKIEQPGRQLLQEGLLITVHDWINTLPASVRQLGLIR
jgi:hypothetical protein